MSDIVERLKGTGAERQRTTAHDTPGHYLHVVAKISNADGRLMDEAADEITRLRAEVEDLGNRLHHVHRLWANNEHALRAEVERLKAALKEIGSITVHSGGDIHGISPTAWRAAFDHAHAVARAALEGEK